jgi:hypothetical protein
MVTPWSVGSPSTDVPPIDAAIFLYQDNPDIDILPKLDHYVLSIGGCSSALWEALHGSFVDARIRSRCAMTASDGRARLN